MLIVNLSLFFKKTKFELWLKTIIYNFFLHKFVLYLKGVQPSCIGGSAVGGGNLGMTTPSNTQTSQSQPVLDPFGL